MRQPEISLSFRYGTGKESPNKEKAKDSDDEISFTVAQARNYLNRINSR